MPAEELLTRQRELNRAFVTLADGLVQDFDLFELLDRLARICVDVLGSDSAGLLVTGANGRLRVVASSSETMRSLELYELQNQEGPCLDSYRTGTPVEVASLDASRQRWPRFAAEALAAGFVSVQALPMRLRDETIGALNLFYRSAEVLSHDDVSIAQALADVATIGILQHRAIRQRETVTDQLQTALNGRLIIEQAKGKLAERGHLDMDEAFSVLREYCRSRRLSLSDTAGELVTGALGLETVLATRR